MRKDNWFRINIKPRVGNVEATTPIKTEDRRKIPEKVNNEGAALYLWKLSTSFNWIRRSFLVKWSNILQQPQNISVLSKQREILLSTLNTSVAEKFE